MFTSNGEKISFKNDNLVITDAEGHIKHQSTCYRLFILFICGDFCLTSGILERAKKFGFSIVFATPGLRITSMIPSKAEGNVLLRKKQYEYDSTKIGARIISNKIHNQCTLLKQRRQKTQQEKETIAKLKNYENDVLKDDLTTQEIMGIEGICAKLYFGTLFAKHNWKAREPRCKPDMTNTLMDIGYSILFSFIDALLEMYGFDVYKGVLHTQFFHRKSLVCDLEEPFRVIIDEAIIKALNLGQVSEKDFWKNQGQFILPWKNSKKYVFLILSALMDYRNEIFIYIQSYYRSFVRGKDINDFPFFDFEEAKQ